MKTVSIVIPTANDIHRLTLTLTSIAFQKADLNKVEVIVISKTDNPLLSSKVETFKGALDIRLYTQTGNSRANARNLGIKNSSGEIILFVDDDLILSPSFIDRHIQLHKNSSDLVVVGEVRNVFFSNIEKRFYAILSNPFNQTYFYEALKTFEMKSKPHPYFSLTRIPFASGINNIPWIGFGTNNASLRKEHLIRLKYFEESYEGWGLDNIEMGLRLYQMGLKYFYEPEAVNYHLSHPRDIRNHLSQFTDNFSKFKKRNPGLHNDLYESFIQGEISIEEFNNTLCGNKNLIPVKEHFYRDYQNLLKWIKFLK